MPVKYLLILLLVTAVSCNGSDQRTKQEVRTMSDIHADSSGDSAGLARDIARITNDDIHWEGTMIGLAPTVTGEAAHRVLQAGEDAIPGLLRALRNEHQFVAAHVLLTFISGVEYGTDPWNGLEVEISADGTVSIDPGQRVDLSDRWQRWASASPRPETLPDLKTN